MCIFFRKWHRDRIIKRSKIATADWRQVMDAMPVLLGLDANEKQRLQDLAILFLHYKKLEGAQELQVNEWMAITIDLQACLPISPRT